MNCTCWWIGDFECYLQMFPGRVSPIWTADSLRVTRRLSGSSGRVLHTYTKRLFLSLQQNFTAQQYNRSKVCGCIIKMSTLNECWWLTLWWRRCWLCSGRGKTRCRNVLVVLEWGHTEMEVFLWKGHQRSPLPSSSPANIKVTLEITHAAVWDRVLHAMCTRSKLHMKSSRCTSETVKSNTSE